MRYLALLALLSSTALAQDVTPTLDLDTVELRVTWVETLAEMNGLRREWGQAPLADDPVFRTKLTGFSVLGREDGEMVCLLFVQKPRRVDDDRTTALGHELMHCLGGAYHD